MTTTGEGGKGNVKVMEGVSVFRGDNKIIFKENCLNIDVELLKLLEKIRLVESIFENANGGLVNRARKMAEIEVREPIMLKAAKGGEEIEVDESD